MALEDLRLDRMMVVYPEDMRYRLGDRVEAMPVDAAPVDVEQYVGRRTRVKPRT